MKRAFTMIELLTVIAIIAIVAAILFPVFGHAKAAAKQSACISNLHQIGTAIVLYMDDSDDVFPAALDAADKFAPAIWNAFPQFQSRIPDMPLMVDVLQPYLKSRDVFKCPSDNGSQMLDNDFGIQLPSLPSMYGKYGSSYFFRTEIAFRAMSQTSFQVPANINVMMDGAGHWHGSNRMVLQSDDVNTYLNLVRGYRYNTLYGDFHVKSVNFDTLARAWATPL